MTKHVNYQLAKLLSEKGFNEPCQFLRVAGKYRINYEKEGDLFDNRIPSTQKPIDWYLAPAIAEVVMWLYEKHGIWIEVHGWINQPVGEEVWDKCFQAFVNGDAMNVSIYKNPTEAYEAAIEYVLINII